MLILMLILMLMLMLILILLLWTVRHELGMDGIDEDMVNEALNKMFTHKDLTAEGAAKLASSRIGGANHLNGINQITSALNAPASPSEVRTSALHVMPCHETRWSAFL